MKKILIFSHAMELGGAERALTGLLHSLNPEKYQVDLFLMRHEGELLKHIPKGVHLLPEIPEYACLAVSAKRVLKKGKLDILLGRIMGKLRAAQFVKKHNLKEDNGVALEYSHKYTCKYMPSVSETEYDLAISFLTPHYFVTEKVKAKKKVAWIHTDYSYIDIDTVSETKMWGAYDYIASISDECTRSFVSKFSELRDKVIRIDNILPVDFIKDQSTVYGVKSEMPEDGSVRLLSVGRFCEAKNFDNVPEICKLIREKGCNIKWYLIGFGGDEGLIREKIEEHDMQEYVVILGKKENPYPYIKACDLYVQPSRYEGKAVTVREAQILNKPVVIAAYATSRSQLTDGFDGVIVPQDNEGCAEGIVKILQNKELQETLVMNTRKKDYTNSKEVEKIYSLIGE